MRTLCEVTWEKDEELEEGVSVTERGKYWLHHWGLQYEIVQLQEGQVGAVSYTVGICEDYDTGEIRCFLPEQIKILGNDIK